MSETPADEIVVRISHLRGTLGIAYHHVANNNEPIIVQRYKRQDVAMVPLWEWRWLKSIEQAIHEGQLSWPPEGWEFDAT